MHCSKGRTWNSTLHTALFTLHTSHFALTLHTPYFISSPHTSALLTSSHLFSYVLEVLLNYFCFIRALLKAIFLHTESFYTQKALTHGKRLHTAIFYPEKLLHTASFYTEAFGHTCLCTRKLLHGNFYTQKLLHRTFDILACAKHFPAAYLSIYLTNGSPYLARFGSWPPRFWRMKKHACALIRWVQAQDGHT